MFTTFVKILVKKCLHTKQRHDAAPRFEVMTYLKRRAIVQEEKNSIKKYNITLVD